MAKKIKKFGVGGSMSTMPVGGSMSTMPVGKPPVGGSMSTMPVGKPSMGPSNKLTSLPSTGVTQMKKGGTVKSFKGDGCVQRGKTKGRFV